MKLRKRILLQISQDFAAAAAALPQEVRGEGFHWEGVIFHLEHPGEKRKRRLGYYTNKGMHKSIFSSER